jgi:hypothetical protein
LHGQFRFPKVRKIIAKNRGKKRNLRKEMVPVYSDKGTFEKGGDTLVTGKNGAETILNLRPSFTLAYGSWTNNTG